MSFTTRLLFAVCVIGLIGLPCGCTVYIPSITSHKLRKRVIECPWCGATFFYGEFLTWEPQILHLDPGGQPIYEVGCSVLGITRRCDQCGRLIVKRGGDEIHLPEGARYLMD